MQKKRLNKIQWSWARSIWHWCRWKRLKANLKSNLSNWSMLETSSTHTTCHQIWKTPFTQKRIHRRAMKLTTLVLKSPSTDCTTHSKRKIRTWRSHNKTNRVIHGQPDIATRRNTKTRTIKTMTNTSQSIWIKNSTNQNQHWKTPHKTHCSTTSSATKANPFRAEKASTHKTRFKSSPKKSHKTWKMLAKCQSSTHFASSTFWPNSFAPWMPNKSKRRLALWNKIKTEMTNKQGKKAVKCTAMLCWAPELDQPSTNWWNGSKRACWKVKRPLK